MELRSARRESFTHDGPSARNALRVVLGVALALGACGSDRPEERLEASRERLEEVQTELAEAKREVEARRQALAAAEQRLERARKEVQQLEEERRNAQQRLARRATDVAIFRALQQELLKRKSLRSVAIVAEVRDGEVTLRGTVPDAALRREAEEIAQKTPGVEKIQNRIRLESGSREEERSSRRLSSDEGLEGAG